MSCKLRPRPCNLLARVSSYQDGRRRLMDTRADEAVAKTAARLPAECRTIKLNGTLTFSFGREWLKLRSQCRQGGVWVKLRSAFWLIILTVCCVAGAPAVAGAQVSVAVTSTVAITVSAGDDISNAGAFTVTNTSGANITISSINISATAPSIFTSMTLTGQVPGSSALAVLSNPNPPGTSNTFDFSALPVLPNGQAATFTLSAVASSSPVPTPTPSASSSDLKRGPTAYAGLTWPSPFKQSRMSSLMLAAMALGMLAMTGRLRRRHLVVLAMALILAATEVGCGNTTNSINGTSTQAVQTITVSSGGAPTGLPANLGSITVQ